jgi:outer membrane protein, multidrug efflux system
MNMKTFVLSLALVAMLSACSLAPRYERPPPPVAASYPDSGQAQGASARPATEIGWREFFTDARLKKLVELALANNRDLRVAVLNIEVARAQYQIQRADLFPTVDAAVSGTRQRTPPSLGQPGVPAVSSQYSVGASVSAYELDLFGRVRSLKDAALASYLASEEARRSVHISLVSQVADAYLSEQSFAEQLELTRQTLTTREDSYRIAQQQFETGTLSAFDLRQSETLVQTARADLASQTRARAQAENALVLLIGEPLPADLPATQPLVMQGILTDVPVGLPSDLLERRPDLLQAEQQLKSANANIGAARAAFFPQITLTGSYGTASDELSGLFKGGSLSWSFLPNLTLPIFDAGRNRANLDVSEARKNIAVANYEKAIQTAFREVADGLAARSTFDQQLEAQEGLVHAEGERLGLAQLRYDNGVASYLDLLDAQRELFSAQQNLIQVRLSRLTNLVDLYRSLGGGWREQAQASAAPPRSQNQPS